jgi:hypothetical protein
MQMYIQSELCSCSQSEYDAMTYDINSFDTSSVLDGCMYMYAKHEIKI